uniref:Annexin A9 n=1 Tax=Pelusios castaneus TaxID=367368 RepID=A0A8C8RR47_9SAUR
MSAMSLTSESSAWGTLGTIKPYLDFDAESDVQYLLEAISSNGIDHGAILDVLTNRTSDQRQQIAEVFQALTQQDLLKSLEAALSGNLEQVIVGLLKLPAQYNAHELRAAMKVWSRDIADQEGKHKWEIPGGDSTNPSSQREGSEEQAGKREQYTAIIDYPLIQQDAAVSQVTSGDRVRPGLTLPCPTLLVFSQYRKSSGLEVEEAICKRFQGDSQAAMLALASVCRNTPRYFAEKLHKAMKGSGPDDKVLIRVLISRSETDLLSIRAEFKKRHGKSLYSCIQAETSGTYQAALLALCRAEDL